MYRDYRRQASVGLAAFYGNKLAALEDALLSAREQLFAAQDQGNQQERVRVKPEEYMAGWSCVLLPLRGK